MFEGSFYVKLLMSVNFYKKFLRGYRGKEEHLEDFCSRINGFVIEFNQCHNNLSL